jgi:hypothetical protein
MESTPLTQGRYVERTHAGLISDAARHMVSFRKRERLTFSRRKRVSDRLALAITDRPIDESAPALMLSCKYTQRTLMQDMDF